MNPQRDQLVTAWLSERVSERVKVTGWTADSMKAPTTKGPDLSG